MHARNVRARVPDRVVHAVLRRHMVYAAAGALVPVPLADLLATGVSQVHLIARLCDLYGVRFSHHAVAAAVASLVATALPYSPLGAAIHSTVRTVPVVGPLLGAATLPGLAAATTWAVGTVFADHFAEGGTLRDFDPDRHGARFARAFAEGRRQAATLSTGQSA